MLNFNLSNLVNTDLHMEMLCSINLPSLSHGVPISSNSSREVNNLEEEIEARGSFYAIPQFIANTRFKINCFTLTAYIVGVLVVVAFEIWQCFDTTGQTVFCM